MTTDLLFKVIFAFLPVIAFLFALYHLDGHRLLNLHRVIWVMIAGGALAVLAYLLNGFFLNSGEMSISAYRRFGAPAVEEFLKATVLIYLFRTNKVGFLIDAAIMGFAVGTGFALLENLFYLYNVTDLHLGDWIIRGFGTAIMHGGATAIFALVSQELTERHAKLNPLLYLPGFIIAGCIHSTYNHFPVNPIFSMTVAFLTLPIVFYLVFRTNAVTIHNWLEADFKAHEKLLDQIKHGDFSHTEAGRFLVDLESVFDGPVIDHMVTYIRIHTELVIDAEGVLLAREDDIEVEVGPEVHQRLHELHHLEKEIGKTGLLALRPHLHFSRKEFWEIYMLEDEDTHGHHIIASHGLEED
jgi:RsiW-degrading membrane proteinase PrsW (M82 family)